MKVLRSEATEDKNYKTRHETSDKIKGVFLAILICYSVIWKSHLNIIWRQATYNGSRSESHS